MTLERILLVAALGLVCPHPAAAEPADTDPSPAARFDAAAERAYQLFEAGEPKDALAALEEAEALAEGLPERAAQLPLFKGRCYLALNQPEAALEAFEDFTARATSEKAKRLGRHWVVKTQRRFYGTVRFECTQAEVRVSHHIKGERPSTQACPAEWAQLVPGVHHFEVVGGKRAGKRRLEVTAGKKLTIDLAADKHAVTALEPPPPPEAPIPTELGLSAHGRLGSSFATGAVDASLDGQATLSAEVGVGADFIWQLGAVGLGPRVELGYHGWRFELRPAGEQPAQETNTHGLRMPLLLLLTLPAQFEVEAGGSVEWLIGRPDDLDRAVLFSAVGGVGWHLPLGDWQARLTLRYSYDLQTLAPTALRRHALLAGLAARFHL